MKFINKICLVALSAVVGLVACEKGPDLPFYDNGTATQVSVSSTTVAPTPADADKPVLTINWTSPKYSTDTASYKFLVQIDSSSRDFSKGTTLEVIGKRSLTLTGKELNDILLSFGFQFNKAYDIDIRVISSYGNNNERYISANKVKVRATPYKVPPKVQLPASGKLFIIGDATLGGWTNPIPEPIPQEFYRIDETTFGGIFYLYGGASYLVLPVNDPSGWDLKYSIADGNAFGAAEGGSFGFKLNSNFPSPAADGYYKVILDFQNGKYEVTAYTQQHGLPTKLAMVGDATPVGWTNDANNTQTFTRLNSTAWQITISLNANKEYLILPVPGNWDYKYGVEDNTVEAAKMGGVFKPQGNNFKSPGTAGNYKIDLNFIDNSYKLTKL